MTGWKAGEERCLESMRRYINELEMFIKEDKGVYLLSPLLDEWREKKK